MPSRVMKRLCGFELISVKYTGRAVIERRRAGIARRGCYARPARSEEEPMYVAPAQRLTLAGARKMIETAMAIAERERVPISIAVADAGGHLIAFERMDGGRFHTVHSSTT